MATTPTQMRLTPSDLKRLDQIKRQTRCATRTSAVRNLIWFFEEYSDLVTQNAMKTKSKKSSVAT